MQNHQGSGGMPALILRVRACLLDLTKMTGLCMQVMHTPVQVPAWSWWFLSACTDSRAKRHIVLRNFRPKKLLDTCSTGNEMLPHCAWRPCQNWCTYLQ